MTWWRRKRRDPGPVEPGPVFVELRDGTRVGPVPLLYVGTDEEGLHVWQGIAPVADGLGEALKMTCEVLPARTTVHLM